VKVLLLGSGGREHALAWALSKSPKLTKLWAAPGSDGMSEAERVDLDPCDPAAVTARAKSLEADLVVIGPEAPLAAGTADALRAAGFAVFGPSKAAARLESSKSFAKDFMLRHGIPTARARVGDAAAARRAVEEFGGRCAVKADGLAGGKGVIVCGDPAEARAAVDALAATGAGKTLVVEERLEGPEVSLMALVDGRTACLLPASQDHKRLEDGDRGPNTGGMGAVAPLPIPAAELEAARREVFDRALVGLAKDGIEYRGALYAGLMMTKDGPKVLEFNARLGDPETQALMPLLDADFLELADDCARGRLRAGRASAKAGAACCVVLAADGYPDAPKPGARLDPDAARAAGGRVLSVVGLGADLAAAREKAYAAVARAGGPGLRWRRDIGAVVLGRSLA
jgi:phosphoribosylamine---glycine ligase